MSEPAKGRATYQDLYEIPENMVGQIIDGELVVTPRPAITHIHAASALGGKLNPPFQFGEGGGPGGWIILDEPEISLGEHILVPDLAGWKKARLVSLPKEAWSSVPPDWICEILSPSTVRVDKIRKMPIYAQHAVAHLWLIDPIAKTLDVFRLESGKWLLLESHAENSRVRIEPFQEIEVNLGDLWLE